MDLVQAKAIFLLSLWKTYAGPLVGLGLEWNYWVSVGITLLGACVSIKVTAYLSPLINRILAKLFGRYRWARPRPFNPKMKKALRFYQRYGFGGLVVLGPILIGIPVAVWVAIRLGSPRERVTVMMFVSAWCWASLSYLVGRWTLLQ